MKAIRRDDGKEIEVRLYHDREYVATEVEDGERGQRIYYEHALIIEDAVDWNAFRREAAKDILAGIATNIQIYLNEKDKCKAAARDAIALADELIKQLKDGK